MFYNNMEVNCKVFSSKQDWRIRVVFGEDGAPYSVRWTLPPAWDLWPRKRRLPVSRGSWW